MSTLEKASGSALDAAARPTPSARLPLEWQLLGPARARVEELWRLQASGCLPPALLFVGPRGVGKFMAARVFAMGLVCEQSGAASSFFPCGSCGACKRVLSDQHPDLFVLDAAADGEQNIKLERIVARGDTTGPTVEEFLSLRSAEGRFKVLLLREIERSDHGQLEVQNALLKLLEEPRPGVLWVLESSAPQRLLDTVRSRLVPVVFARLSNADFGAWMAAQGLDLDPNLARWARGSPGRAMELQQCGAKLLRPLIAGTLDGSLDALQAARAVLAIDLAAESTARGEPKGTRRSGKAKAKPASELSLARQRARAALELALEVVSDLVRGHAGVDQATLVHMDLELAAVPWRADSAWYQTRLDALLRAASQLEHNVDPTLALECAWLALAPEQASRVGA